MGSPDRLIVKLLRIKNIIKRYKVIKIIHYIVLYIMYKKEGLVDSIKGVLSSEEKKLDTIDIEFYNNLYEINKVFEEKKYKCKIGSKISPD